MLLMFQTSAHCASVGCMLTKWNKITLGYIGGLGKSCAILPIPAAKLLNKMHF